MKIPLVDVTSPLDFDAVVKRAVISYPRHYRHFLQTGAAPPLPQSVSIETTAACQLACKMCDRSHLRRQYLLMPDEVFKAVIDAIAPHRIGVSFSGIGEPLLDKKLPERIAYARSQGIPEAALVTNGLLLVPELARELIKAGLTRINISLDGADQASLETGHQGADYQVVSSNIESLLQVKQELAADYLEVVLRVTVQQGNLATLPAIFRRWHGHVSTIQPNLVYQYGSVETDPCLPFRWQERVPCPQMLTSMLVLTDGSATLCCLGDINAELGIGNLAHSSLLDCYDGPRAREIRALHRQGDLTSLPVCQRCVASTLSNFECGAVSQQLAAECQRMLDAPLAEPQ